MTAPAQQSLLTWTPPQPSPRASEQGRQIARVSGKIAESVIAFCRLHVGETFIGVELCDYVRARCGGSPESALRVMRDLRKQGVIAAPNGSRSKSIYRVERAP